IRRRSSGSSCSHRPIAAGDIESSILQNLVPVLGAQLDWVHARDSIARIQYDWAANGVQVTWKDGTRLEYELPWPDRPGADGGEKETDRGRVPRVSRLMALAIKFERQVLEGSVRNYRDIADAGHVSRARLSQIMHLRDLAPSIQEELLFLPRTLSGSDQ